MASHIKHNLCAEIKKLGGENPSYVVEFYGKDDKCVEAEETFTRHDNKKVA